MTRYQNGANFERFIADILRYWGYYVVRSAGSHGVVDLLGVRRARVFVGESEVIGVQAKLHGNISKSEKQRLLGISRDFGFTPYIAYKAGRGDVRIEEAKEEVDGI